MLAHSLLENDLHARAQILAGVRRGRISFLGRWDGSGGITRDNYLTPTSPDVTATAPYPNLPRLPVSRAMADGTLESQVGADFVAEVRDYSSEAAASISRNGSHHPLFAER